MKILHTVESYNPAVNGMQEVVNQISERLVKMGHEVTIATRRIPERTFKELNGVKIIEFDVDGNFVRGMKGEVNRYQKFLLDSNFDIVTNFAAQQWATDISLPILERMKGVKVFVPTGFSGFYQPEFKNYFELMKEWLHKYDMNLFLSDDYRDVNFAKDNGVEKRMLIPNGADEREFLKPMDIGIRAKYEIPEDAFLIFTVGSHTGLKGHKEAIEMFRRSKLKNAVLFINANPTSGGCTDYCALQAKEFNKEKANKDSNKRLIVTFPPRVDTVNLYKSADLFLFPSNIEASPIVIFEAMAAKTPFLSSDVGNVSEIIKWSNGGKLLPMEKKDLAGYSYADVAKSTEALNEIYSNSEERKQLAESGYKAWSEKYTWEQIVKDYENLYKKLLKEHEEKKILNVKTTVIAIAERSTVDKQLNILKNQTLKPDEIIFISKDTDIQEDIKDGELKVRFLNTDTTKILESQNLAAKEAKGEVIIFLDTSDIWENTRVESLVSKYILNDKANGWIYPNFNTMETNKGLSEYFSTQELGLEFRGDIFGALLEQNKICTSISGTLIRKDVFDSSNGFDVSLNTAADWDLVLNLTKSTRADFIFVYENLKSNPLYLNTRMDPLNKSVLKDQVKFFNKWAPNLQSNPLVTNRWANFLIWRVNLNYPDKVLLKVLSENISTEAKKVLFRKSKGSFKGYLVIFVVYTYVKGFIGALQYIYRGLVDLIKKLFWITF